MSSLRALAAAVDGLSARRRAQVTETTSAITIAALGSNDAVELHPLLSALQWSFEIMDSAGERADYTQLTADYAPFVVTVSKPENRGVVQLVTVEGLRSFLSQEQSDVMCEVAMLATSFSSMSTSFVPWGASSIFSPARATKSPRQLVRDHNLPPKTPSDIRVWLIRNEVSDGLWSDAIFQVFADLSAQHLMRALSGEIKNDGVLVFRGPPHTQIDAPSDGAAEKLGLSGYNQLRASAAWVYENELEAERRHGLFVAEFGRTHPPQGAAATIFREIVGDVLSGAKLAYQLSLSDITREAIKAQGDLRKAVADDTAKLADNTRQVAAAVAAALATCVGLVAAKLTTSTPEWVLKSVAAVAAIYVASVVCSGWVFMSVQHDMRDKWRSRLYRFIPDSDFDAMVKSPAKKAELMFKSAAVAGGLASCAALVVVFFVY